MLHVLWSGVIFGLLMTYKVSGETLTSETSYTSDPYCAGSPDTQFQPACGSAIEVIAVESIQHGTKHGTTCGLLDTSANCCQYDSGDCLIPYTADGTSSLLEDCSGKQVCSGSNPAAVETPSCGSDYPDYSHYYTMSYYCLPGSRISETCLTESRTVTGNLLYLKNQEYPHPIKTDETGCSCSIEAKSCDSQINVYILHLDLSNGTPGVCNSNQRIIITDRDTTHTYTCSDDNNYVITKKMASTSNYITVQLDNPDGVNDGHVWIGFEATNSAHELTLDCPAKIQTLCMDCPSLIAPTNGDVSHPTKSYQSEATYTCNPGYTLNGDITRICDDDGTWSGSAPTCQIIDCPSLTAPTDGDVSYTTTTYQSVATYTCSLGYTLNGDATRSCGADGTWSSSTPTCQIIDCSSLTAPTKGDVSHPTTTYQSVANYTCHTGYTLNGDTTRVCGDDGTWSGSTPTCQMLVQGLGDSCTMEVDCTTVIAHSTCTGGVCSCADGYTKQNGNCKVTPKKEPDGLSTGVIVAIVIVVVVVVVVAIILIIFCIQGDRYKRAWKQIKDRLSFSSQEKTNPAHSLDDVTEIQVISPAPEKDNAANEQMEQGFNGADEQEATVSVRHEPEQANTSEAPSLSPTFRVAQPLHFNMDDIHNPVPALPALYPELSNLTLIDVQPTLTNVPPVATNDTAETNPLRSALRNTLPLLGDIQQALSDCSLSESESLPVSVDVCSQPNTLLSDEPPIQSRNLTPVSSI